MNQAEMRRRSITTTEKITAGNANLVGKPFLSGRGCVRRWRQQVRRRDARGPFELSHISAPTLSRLRRRLRDRGFTELASIRAGQDALAAEPVVEEAKGRVTP